MICQDAWCGKAHGSSLAICLQLGCGQTSQRGSVFQQIRWSEREKSSRLGTPSWKLDQGGGGLRSVQAGLATGARGSLETLALVERGCLWNGRPLGHLPQLPPKPSSEGADPPSFIANSLPNEPELPKS